MEHKCFTRFKKKRTKIHRLSTATNDIVDENREEVNQGHRVELNIRGRGRGTELPELEVKCPLEETVSVNFVKYKIIYMSYKTSAETPI